MTKKKDTSHLNAPNYEAMTSVEEVELEIEKRKNVLVGKDRTEYQIKENKKEFNVAVNEQLRDLKEEREHEIVVLSALEDRKRLILTSAGVIPMRS